MPWPIPKITTADMDNLDLVTKRTRGVRADTTAFRIAASEDITEVINQLNNVYYNLARTLASVEDLDAVQFGLSGNVIFTDLEAVETTGELLWNSGEGRGNTIKESMLVVASRLKTLENSIAELNVIATDGTEIFQVNGIVTSNAGGTYAVDDFVFGSPVLGYDGDTNHAARFWFDKSKGALRAGTESSGAWDSANVGVGSFAWNENTVTGIGSVAFGSGGSVVANTSGIVAGSSNTVSSGAHNSGIVAGSSGTVRADSLRSIIGSGNSNDLRGEASFIGAGSSNAIRATSATASNTTNAAIVAGASNIMHHSTHGFMGAGSANRLGSDGTANGGFASNFSVVVGGSGNKLGNAVSSTYSVIVGGLNGIVNGDSAFLGGGSGNEIYAEKSAVVAGSDNLVSDSSLTGSGFGNIFIGAGESNVIYGGRSAIAAGGFNQIATLGAPGQIDNFIGAGSGNSIGATSSAIAAGDSNEIDGHDSSFIGAGTSNAIGGSTGVGAQAWNFIVGGRQNSISTIEDSLVSYSGIGGGQLNSIGNTDATTNYCFIGGGYSNEIGGAFATSYCVIAGGQNNTLAMNGATGGWSVIGGGRNNELSGNYSSIVAGFGNSILDSNLSFIGSGDSNLITSNNSAVLTGDNCILNAAYSVALNGDGHETTSEYSIVMGRLAKSYNHGEVVHATGSLNATAGTNQRSDVVWFGTTSGNTLTEIFLDGSGSQFILEDNSTYVVEGIISSRISDGTGVSAGYLFSLVIDRIGSAASTALVGAVVKTVVAEDNANWDFTIDADTTSGALRVQVQGDVGQDVNWTVAARIVKVKAAL